MTLTQFVKLIELMRTAQIKKSKQDSVKWITECIRLERLVDDTIDAFYREQQRKQAKQQDMFDET